MEGNKVYYKFIKNDLYRLYAAVTSLGLCKISFENSKSEFMYWINKNYPGFGIIEEDNDFIKEVEKQIFEYYAGSRKKFDLKLDLRVTEFQKKVLKALLNVPYGCCATYGDIAYSLGSKKYSRAVGNTLNKNPLPIIIPCHRIIDSKGGIGGFGGGVDIKKKLLKTEGALFV